jgi:hypothetical protein
MRNQPLLATVGAVAALALAITVPDRTHGQAASDEAALAALISELAAQQTNITANQAKIDEKIAAIAEDIRVARIFVGRGGGGKSN